MSKVMQEVEGLLKQDERNRNSDKQLLVSYWASHGLHLDNQQYKLFMELSTPETLTRCRRAIQMEREDLQATPEVTEARYRRFKEKKEAYTPTQLDVDRAQQKEASYTGQLFNIEPERRIEL